MGTTYVRIVSCYKDEDIKDKYMSDVVKTLSSTPIPEDLNGKWLRIKNAVLTSAFDNLKPEMRKKSKSYISATTENWILKRKELFNEIASQGKEIDPDMIKHWHKCISKSLHRDQKVL